MLQNTYYKLESWVVNADSVRQAEYSTVCVIPMMHLKNNRIVIFSPALVLCLHLLWYPGYVLRQRIQ